MTSYATNEQNSALSNTLQVMVGFVLPVCLAAYMWFNPHRESHYMFALVNGGIVWLAWRLMPERRREKPSNFFIRGLGFAVLVSLPVLALAWMLGQEPNYFSTKFSIMMPIIMIGFNLFVLMQFDD